MLLINRWPQVSDFELPSKTVTDLMNLLKEPFEDEAATQRAWQELGIALIVIGPNDSLSTLEAFSDRMVEQIRFALQYPETEDALSEGYQLVLAITSDNGGGFYLLIHRESPVLEALSHG